MESVLGFILRAVGYILINGVLYLTGRAVLPVLTFGWWRVQALSDQKSHVGWYGFGRQRDGTILIGPEWAIFLGAIVWILVVFTLIKVL